MAIAIGAPAWVDLATGELDTARDFYQSLFGWHWIEHPGYQIAVKEGVPVAGLLPQTDLPTAWNLYLECGSAHRAADQVPALGGKILFPPTETGNKETFLVVEDPTGAVVGLWQAPPDGIFGRDHAGMLCWAELHTRDGSTADPFYAELFGYRQEQIGEPGNGFDYAVFYVDDQPTVGRFETSLALPQTVPAHWQIYFQVNPEHDVDCAATKAEELGGKILLEPSDSPHGRITHLQDPLGAAFFAIDTARRTGE